MKKLIFANCILAIAVIFSFCAKPDLKEELSSVNTSDAASSRISCLLTNNPSNASTTLTLCGTKTNKQFCNSCLGLSNGVAVFVGGFININLEGPIEFTISNTTATALNLTTPGGTIGPISMNANDCKKFSIDANCVITQI